MLRWRPGPGLVLVAAFIGPGTVTTATLAGAEHGYALLWVVPLAILLAFVLQEMAARPALAARTPPAQLLLEGGPGSAGARRALAVAAVGAVVLGATAFEAGNFTGASLGLSTVLGGGRAGWVLASADLAFLLLWFGRYRAIERVLVALVALMGLSFLATLVVARPDAGAVARGLVPRLDGVSIGLALALVGTTVVPYNLFLHGAALAAKGEAGPASIRPMRLDLGASLVLGCAITAATLLAAGAVLQGQTIESGADMARSIEPLLGPVAEAAFGLGLFAAGFTSAVTAPLAAALAVAQVRRAEPGARAPRTVWIPVLALGTAVALLPVAPLPLIVAAQVANAFILPLLALGFLFVANRRQLGTHRNGLLANVAGVGTVLVTLGLGLWLLL